MNKVANYIIPCLTILCLACINCTAQEMNQSGVETSAQQQEDTEYAYKSDGRNDPFKPFVSKASASAHDPNEVVEDNVEYSGMQLFEPGQLTLVGIMAASRGSVAMVEDQTKKGYLLKIGDLIGKRGVVTSIDEHQVVITETARTRSGKAIKDLVTMKIKREGDK